MQYTEGNRPVAAFLPFCHCGLRHKSSKAFEICQQRKKGREAIERRQEQLDARNNIILSSFREGLSLKDIGAKFGLSAERVRQIVADDRRKKAHKKKEKRDRDARIKSCAQYKEKHGKWPTRLYYQSAFLSDKSVAIEYTESNDERMVLLNDATSIADWIAFDPDQMELRARIISQIANPRALQVAIWAIRQRSAALVAVGALNAGLRNPD